MARPAEKLKIVYVSSEASPLVKTGGLADVAGSLPQALADLGHDVSVFLPAYKCINREKYPLLSESAVLQVPLGGEERRCGVLRSGAISGVSVRLIDQPDLFGRDGLYDEGGIPYPDNAVRFAFFPRAVIELIRLEGNPPDIIHCNDWQTALLPVFLKTCYRDDPCFRSTQVLFTIHNIAYQGTFPQWMLGEIGLPEGLYVTEGGLEFYGKISYLKGGILFSDLITTVSPSYSREIQTEEYGFGMEGVLKSRADSLVGVLNGIDVQQWNPAADSYLPEAIGPGDWEERESVKRTLMKVCGLDYEEGIPLVGIVSRLAGQKGFDLIEAAADRIMESGVFMVVLGRGERRYEELFLGLKARYPDRLFVRLDFDDPLAHLIYGGCDIFMMPSRYEPCGLGQMIAMRYGAVPLARKTGGLADTIIDEGGKRNGFLFEEFSPSSLLRAFDRALKAYHKREGWREIMMNGMRGNYSWRASAGRYLEIYRNMARKVKDGVRS